MNEYIERTALRDALYDADAITMQGVKILNQFPAADVAPVVHGRWIWNEECCTWDCTNCNGFVGSGSRISAYVHCPLCGAKMDGSGDG